MRKIVPLLGYCLALALLLSRGVAAAPEVLVLPVELPGYYTPVDSEDLTKTLEAGLKKFAPQVPLQVSRAADLTAYGYRSGAEQPPTSEMAERICRAYQASHLCWVSVRFQPSYQAETGALALAGAARFWAYSADRRQVAFDQSLSLVRVGELKRPEDELAAKSVARTLAQGCINDLAYQIVGLARQRSVRPPASAASWAPYQSDPTHSKNYRAMASAIGSYQKAVRDQSLVDITTSQAALTRGWTALNSAERQALEENYPGIKDAMTQVPVYNYGGWGWGPYFPR